MVPFQVGDSGNSLEQVPVPRMHHGHLQLPHSALTPTYGGAHKNLPLYHPQGELGGAGGAADVSRQLFHSDSDGQDRHERMTVALAPYGSAASTAAAPAPASIQNFDDFDASTLGAIGLLRPNLAARVAQRQEHQRQQQAAKAAEDADGSELDASVLLAQAQDLSMSLDSALDVSVSSADLAAAASSSLASAAIARGDEQAAASAMGLGSAGLPHTSTASRLLHALKPQPLSSSLLSQTVPLVLNPRSPAAALVQDLSAHLHDQLRNLLSDEQQMDQLIQEAGSDQRGAAALVVHQDEQPQA
jgi:hypothetical protein